MLHHLPNGTGTAAENMADDLLLLENYPVPEAARFRHYTWSEPAFTFGLSQNWRQVRATLPEQCALIRRASGGGVVSHLDDWTYALVVPFAHPLCRARATESYRAIHQALADALAVQAVPVALVPCPDAGCATAPEERAAAHKPGVCFVAPEIFDVVLAADGRKVAGAAQKRNRHGLLVQGSIARAVAGAGVDWTRFEDDFIRAVATVLAVPVSRVAAPAFEENLREETVARFASRAWNERH